MGADRPRLRPLQRCSLIPARAVFTRTRTPISMRALVDVEHTRVQVELITTRRIVHAEAGVRTRHLLEVPREAVTTEALGRLDHVLAPDGEPRRIGRVARSRRAC